MNESLKINSSIRKECLESGQIEPGVQEPEDWTSPWVLQCFEGLLISKD